VEKRLSCLAHTQEIAGSSPASAKGENCMKREAEYFIDFLGNKIVPGDRVVYSTREANTSALNVGIVKKIEEHLNQNYYKEERWDTVITLTREFKSIWSSVEKGSRRDSVIYNTEHILKYPILAVDKAI
jgi:hypothetical protein